MVPAPFGRDVVRKYWLTHDLMRALALRRIESVEFGDGDIHRQHVRWDNGGQVWINRGASDWTVAGHTIPQYGFYARVPVAGGVVEAAIERRRDASVEWSRAGSTVYVDARAAGLITFGDVTTDGACRIVREGEAATVTPLPDGGPSTVRLARYRASRIEALDETGRVLRTVPVRNDGDTLTFTSTKDAFAYRLRP